MIACHTFLIQATDAGKRSSIAQMTITVEDENDNIPTFERSYFNISVDEDTDVSWMHATSPGQVPMQMHSYVIQIKTKIT